MLTTKNKVLLASAAQRVVEASRSLFGKDYRVNVSRNGLRWDLDLREGIDFSIYLLGAFEAGTQKRLAELIKPGDVVFDIGANVGAHTLPMACSVGAAGKVFAVEPADFAFAKLRRNLSLNPELEHRVHTFQLFFLADKIMITPPKEVYASWPLGRDQMVHPKHRGRLVPATQATVETLDSFVERHLIDRIDLIKIDVDGQELPVLRGGLTTLLRFHPILIMEMAPYVHVEHDQSFADLVELLKTSGYSLRNADNWKPVPLDVTRLERLIPDGASINVIAADRTTGFS